MLPVGTLISQCTQAQNLPPRLGLSSMRLIPANCQDSPLSRDSSHLIIFWPPADRRQVLGEQTNGGGTCTDHED